MTSSFLQPTSPEEFGDVLDLSHIHSWSIGNPATYFCDLLSALSSKKFNASIWMTMVVPTGFSDSAKKRKTKQQTNPKRYQICSTPKPDLFWTLSFLDILTTVILHHITKGFLDKSIMTFQERFITLSVIRTSLPKWSKCIRTDFDLFIFKCTCFLHLFSLLLILLGENPHKLRLFDLFQRGPYQRERSKFFV